MRRAALLTTVVWAAACAQTVLPPVQGVEFFGRRGLGALKCQVEPLRPVLDFEFRFHAGYTVRAPLNQYRDPGHKWTVAVRIQPESAREPVYFTDSLTLPDVSSTGTEGEAGGGYLLGQGRYRASFLLVDDLGRGCRMDWNIEAQPGAGNGAVKMAIEPGAVQEVSWRGARAANSDAAPFAGITVLLHAAPVSPRLSKVQASDAVTLLGALSSLLDLAPAESVRLVVFNLEQQKEIYRQEHFTLDRMEAVRQAIFDLQLAVVDYRALLNPAGPMDLLSTMVNRELHAERRSDAVVFLGPHARSTRKPTFEVDAPGSGAPRFFYVEYQWSDRYALMGRGSIAGSRAVPPGSGSVADGSRRGGGCPVSAVCNPADSSGPPIMPTRDTIDYLVAMLAGKTLVVHTPGDFAKAMKQIAPWKAAKSPK